MEFRNLTPFPALAFAGLDALNQSFHVAVLKQTLTWDGAGRLIYADKQEPLCAADQHYGEPGRSSVRQESDFCAFKPQCDVILNATAYAPRGQASARFRVRLRVFRGGKKGPITAEDILIDKDLTITGPRKLKKRALAAEAECDPTHDDGTSQWVFTKPEPIASLDIRYEKAFGGECRIEADDAAAGRVPNEQRLEPGLSSSGAPLPTAHTRCKQNVAGIGFVEPWYVAAKNLEELPAPQIEYTNAPLTAAAWETQLTGDARAHTLQPAGLGVRRRGHPERRKYLGTVDDEFKASDAWLPRDFSFAYYNGAPTDQQCDELRGDEHFALLNLCAAGTPGAVVTPSGDTLLQLHLGGDVPFMFARFLDGSMRPLPTRLDTVIIEPEMQQVTLVWRAVVAVAPAVRVCEARLRHRSATAA
jgi:hypothetical protein